MEEELLLAWLRDLERRQKQTQEHLDDWMTKIVEPQGRKIEELKREVASLREKLAEATRPEDTWKRIQRATR